MRPLQVDPTGLKLLATRCRAWSAELAAMHPPAPPATVSATAAAVGAVHSAVCALSDGLAQRMRLTATLLDEAACGYLSSEAAATMALDG